tara:strand:+ start:3692 stop:3991 length:300 start_codon:yes stop_codon:yes gene_type:complete
MGWKDGIKKGITNETHFSEYPPNTKKVNRRIHKPKVKYGKVANARAAKYIRGKRLKIIDDFDELTLYSVEEDMTEEQATELIGRLDRLEAFIASLKSLK